MKNKTLYKFMRTNLKSNNGKERDWKLGEWRKEENISICNSGFHASETPLQAMSYVAGEILALVEVRGDSIIRDTKQCWSEMRIVKAWHWTKEDSVSLAIFAAESCIKNFEDKYPDDKRPREAIEAAKKWLNEPTEGNRLAADAATDATDAAASAAADAAADAAARAASAATDAARAASAAANAAANAASAAANAAANAAADAAADAASAAANAIGARQKITKELDLWFAKRIKKLKTWEQK